MEYYITWCYYHGWQLHICLEGDHPEFLTGWDSDNKRKINLPEPDEKPMSGLMFEIEDKESFEDIFNKIFDGKPLSDKEKNDMDEKAEQAHQDFEEIRSVFKEG